MKLDEWLKKMEKIKQADIPMDFGGKIMTPRQFVSEVQTGVVSVSLAFVPTSVFNEKDLLKDRFERRYANGMVHGGYIMGLAGETGFWSPERQLEAVRNDTPMGEKFLLMERGLMQELKRQLGVS